MKSYSKHKKQFVAVDCIIFGYDIHEKAIRLLLVKRSFNPAKGLWSLAGGFVEPAESLDAAASRVLRDLTGLKNIFMKQLCCFGEPKRDPGARVISVAYRALIRIRDIDKKAAEKNGARWHSMKEMPKLIFDHPVMVEKALKELRLQLRINPAGFELLPDKFTLVQLADLYEAIYRKIIDKRNFRKKLLSMNILDKLDEKEKETSKRGAYYYRFNKEKYKKFIKNGYNFNLDVN